MLNRPKSIQSITYHQTCGCGDIFVTCGNHPKTKKLFEVIVTLGKAGGCGIANKATIGGLISLALKGGIDPVEIVKPLSGVSCHNANPIAGVPSCIEVIAQSIKEHCSLQ